MIARFRDEPPTADPSKAHVSQDLTHDRPLICCRFDPSGRFVFAGSEDETVRRWDLAGDGKSIGFKGHESWVFCLACTPDGQALLSGGGDGRLAWWPVESGEESTTPIRSIEAHDGWVNDVAVSPDGALIATGGNDRLARLWSAEGEPLAELPGHERPIYRVAFVPDGKFLLTADLFGRVVHWEIATRKEVRRLDAGKLYKYEAGQAVDYGGVRDISLSVDGKLLACSGLIEASNPLGAVSNPAVVLFDFETGEEVILQRPKADLKGVGWGVRFHPDGFLVMASGGTGGGNLLFFRPGEPNEFATFKLPNTARALDLHPDGLRLATAHHDGHLRITRLTDPESKAD
jgi:WD40 repeat protein